MMTFIEMVNDAAGLTGRDDSVMKTKIKASINRRYKEIMRSSNAVDLNQVTSFTATSGSSDFGLPQRVRGVFSLYDTGSDRVFKPMGISRLSERYLTTLGISGLPHSYSRLGTKPVQQLPAAATTITFTSDGSDSGVNIRVVGYNGDVRLSDSVAVSATSVNSYTDLLQAVKDGDSNGTITIDAAGTTIGQIGPMVRSSRYEWVRFDRAFSSDTTVNVVYKEDPPKLVNDEDTPLLDVEDILIQGGFVDSLKAQRQHAKARVEEGKFQQLLNDWITESLGEDEDFGTQPDGAWLQSHNKNLMGDDPNATR